MTRTPYIDPVSEQFEAFKNLPVDEPIHMLNLIKFKDKATYEDGRDVTGKEAYAEYGQKTNPLLAKAGGKIIWGGSPKLMLIGPDYMDWDQIFVVYYPSAANFIKMITDPEYQKIVKHRQAAVEDSRLIRCEGWDVGS